ncbi:hypothetical protein [Enterobacter hormaechei]|uniref:hypothetical protein n=1 Tax=Enterobacter hormaechei TaxID=158836 RepID=UPI0034D2190B
MMNITAGSGINIALGIIADVGVSIRDGVFISSNDTDHNVNVVGEIAFLYMKKSGFSKLFHEELVLNSGLESHQVYYCSLIPGRAIHYITEPYPTGKWRTLFATSGGGPESSDYIGVWQKVSD